MKSWLKNELKELYPGIDFDILVPPSPEMGDYSVNLAFVLAKKEGKNPVDVGKDIVAKLNEDKDLKYTFKKIELAGGGYVNFRLSESFLREQIKKIHSDKSYGSSREGNGKRVIIEYGGVNIAKPMHIGHLRSTIIGDALANVYEFLGYEVIRWNYVGDWGTQFGNLIVAYKKWVDRPAYQADPIAEMLRLYVKFHDELKSNPELEKEGREEFRKLENGDLENRKIWQEFSARSLQEFNKLFNELSVALGQSRVVTKGESSYELRLKSLVNELRQKGFIKESEGALIFELDNLPPAMFQKSDGATLYMTRDLASLEDRLLNYKADRVLYVVANQQALHFEQLFAIAEKIGLKMAELFHVKFGMVLGEEGKKFATREGNAVILKEVVDKIVLSAIKETKERNLDEKMEKIQKIGKAIGIGALKYNDLKQHPYSDIVFDWKAMLDIHGNSGPYLQYTYARLKHIEKNSRFFPPIRIRGKRWYLIPKFLDYPFLIFSSRLVDKSKLTLQEDFKIIKKLIEFPEVVLKSAESNTLNGLALYLYELSAMANYYYETVINLSDIKLRPERNARLLLIKKLLGVLKRGLNLLGIETLERI